MTNTKKEAMLMDVAICSDSNFKGRNMASDRHQHPPGVTTDDGGGDKKQQH